MSSLLERPKTIFCDIDGTLWNHIGGVPDQAMCQGHELLPNTIERIRNANFKVIQYRIA